MNSSTAIQLELFDCPSGGSRAAAAARSPNRRGRRRPGRRDRLTDRYGRRRRVETVRISIDDYQPPTSPDESGATR